MSAKKVSLAEMHKSIESLKSKEKIGWDEKKFTVSREAWLGKIRPAAGDLHREFIQLQLLKQQS